MGMFDYVNYEMKCPTCGETVTGFQSKSGPCLLITVDPWSVDNFYSSCKKCGTWIEYESGTWENYINEICIDFENLDKPREHFRPCVFQNFETAVSLLKEYSNISTENDVKEVDFKITQFLKKVSETTWLDYYTCKVSPK